MKTSLYIFLILLTRLAYAQGLEVESRIRWLKEVKQAEDAFERGDYRTTYSELLGAEMYYDEYKTYTTNGKKEFPVEDRMLKAKCDHLWGLACLKSGDEVGAAARFRTALASRKRYLGDEHADTKATQAELNKIESSRDTDWKNNLKVARQQLNEGTNYESKMKMAASGLFNYLRKKYPNVKNFSWKDGLQRKFAVDSGDAGFRRDLRSLGELYVFQATAANHELERRSTFANPREIDINTAIQIFDALGDKSMAAHATFCLGQLEYHWARYDKSEKDLLKTIDLFESADSLDQKDCIGAHLVLNKIYSRRGQFSQGEAILLAGKRRLPKGPDRMLNYTEYAIALYDFYVSNGNYRSAELLLDDYEPEVKGSQTIYRAYFLAMRGNYELLNERFENAAKLLLQAEELYKEFKVKYSYPVANIYRGLRDSFFAQRDYQKSYDYSFKLVFIHSDDVASKVTQRYSNLSMLSAILRMRTYSTKPNETSHINELSQDFLSSFDFPDKRFKRKGSSEYSLEAFSKDFAIVTKQLKALIKKIKTDLKGVHPDQAAIFNSLGLAYMELDSLDQAGFYLKEAMRVVEEELKTLSPNLSMKDKELLLKFNRRIFANYESACLSAVIKDPKGAQQTTKDWYDYKLKFKGFMASNERIIMERIANSSDPALQQRYRNWRSLNDSIAGTTRTADFPPATRRLMEETAQSMERDMIRSLELSGVLTPTVVNWLDVQGKLESGEAAVEISRISWITDTTRVYSAEEKARKKRNPRVRRTSYAALVIKSGAKAPEVIFIGEGEKLERVAPNFKTLMEADIRSEELYNMFWKALAGSLKRHKKIFLSPDGVYSQINLNTLKNPANGKYVIDEFDIQLLGSTREIRMNVLEKKGAIKKASLFGSPDFKSRMDGGEETRNVAADLKNEMSDKGVNRFFDGGTIDPLPGSKIEVERIDQLMRSQQVVPSTFIGGMASEGEMKKLAGNEVLHIATHGYFLSDRSLRTDDTFAGMQTRDLFDNPLLRSGLLLAGAQASLDENKVSSKGEDGILTAQEVLGLNLGKTQLIVLSACETGLGVVVNGEGVYGLQRSFQIAGARAVLMSLWSVDDTSTQELMTLFYEYWLKGKPVAEAFRTAQLELRKKYPNPYYWGPFVLVGEF